MAETPITYKEAKDYLADRAQETQSRLPNDTDIKLYMDYMNQGRRD
jgi:DNA-directed RNA polymerase subunit F